MSLKKNVDRFFKVVGVTGLVAGAMGGSVSPAKAAEIDKSQAEKCAHFDWGGGGFDREENPWRLSAHADYCVPASSPETRGCITIKDVAGKDMVICSVFQQ